MKRIYVLLTALFCLITTQAQLSDKEEAALDKLIEEQVDFEADEVSSSAIKEVFNAEFFKVKRVPHFKNDGAYTEALFVKAGGELTEMLDATGLTAYLNASFVIKSEQHAKRLQTALTLLLDEGGGLEQSMTQKENCWLLVQNEWFGEKRGYTVEVDAKGIIQSITYSENLNL